MYERVDLNEIKQYCIHERKDLIDIETQAVFVNSIIAPLLNPDQFRQIELVAHSFRRAKENGGSRILFTGAHSIKNGCAPLITWLMRHGYLTHVAMNGAAVIHDIEFSLKGSSTESVAENLKDGTFGFVQQTADLFSALVKGANQQNEGVGEYLSKNINNLLSPTYSAYGVISNAESSEVMITIHPAIGQDIIHYAISEGWDAFFNDFNYFIASVCDLDGGVFLNCGSSVAGPMIFEKALSAARNLKGPFDNFTIVVNDIQPSSWDWNNGEPPKSHPDYYLRFMKTFRRSGGALNYLNFDNVQMLYWLCRELKENG